MSAGPAYNYSGAVRDPSLNAGSCPGCVARHLGYTMRRCLLLMLVALELCLAGCGHRARHPEIGIADEDTQPVQHSPGYAPAYPPFDESD